MFSVHVLDSNIRLLVIHSFSSGSVSNFGLSCLTRFCKPIMTKPRPVPAKPQTPPTTAPGEQSQAHEGENASGEPKADEDSHAPPQPAPEPMDTDKSETVPSA